MPKVYKRQKETFESVEIFRRLARDGEIKYTGHKDRPLLERQRRCAEGCRQGRADIAFLSCGINLSMRFFPPEYDSPIPPIPYVDFEAEPGKVHFIAPLIFNGVCVNVKGYINLTKLDGSARMIFDPDRAQIEADKENNPVKQECNKGEKGDKCMFMGGLVPINEPLPDVMDVIREEQEHCGYNYNMEGYEKIEIGRAHV